MKTRFLTSVIATARTTDVQMPWHRSLRAARRAERDTKVIVLATRRPQLAKAA